MGRTTLQDEQAPIDKAIADELIVATPEWWASAQLEVSATSPNEAGESLRYTISNPDGLQDRVEPTPELRQPVERLAGVFGKRGHPWRYVRYTARQLPNSEDWDCDIEFKYWSQ